MNKLIFASIFALTLLTFSCSPTPGELAQQSLELHKQLEAATNKADSTEILNRIITLETEARETLSKDEFKEYARTAHPDKD